MKNYLLLCSGVLLLSFLTPSAARAGSEADCAIWLCLPGGFPPACGAAYKAFMHRIKHRKPPLPNLSSCMVGPSGVSGSEKVSGKYKQGYERYESCREGYVLRESNDNGMIRGVCLPASCASAPSYHLQYFFCRGYDAVRRAKPHYVKMWVNGDYLGQYFY